MSWSGGAALQMALFTLRSWRTSAPRQQKTVGRLVTEEKEPEKCGHWVRIAWEERNAAPTWARSLRRNGWASRSNEMKGQFRLKGRVYAMSRVFEGRGGTNENDVLAWHRDRAGIKTEVEEKEAEREREREREERKRGKRIRQRERKKERARDRVAGTEWQGRRQRDVDGDVSRSVQRSAPDSCPVRLRGRRPARPPAAVPIRPLT